MKLRYFTLILAVLTAASRPLFAVGRPENVLVVQNTSSPVSMRIAQYYMSARGIPAQNLASISLVDSSLSETNEIITLADYQSKVEDPIKNYLTANGLTDQIQYIVLTKGIPHRLSAEVYGGTSGGQSVDSLLAALDLVNPLVVGFEDSNKNFLGAVCINRYWRSPQPYLHSINGGYLVTRLDGLTEADAKSLVDHAQGNCASPLKVLLDANSAQSAVVVNRQPLSILLPDGTMDPNYQFDYADYDGDIARASQIISARPFLNVQLDQSSSFMSNNVPMTLYCSWGSNGSGYSAALYHSLTFAPRAIGETVVSTSARTLLPTTWGQSQVVDLVAQGISGVKGYVTEPYLDSIAVPTVYMDFYTSGRNLAESFYAASRFVGWKDIVLGDPLCALDLTDGRIRSAKQAQNSSLVTIRNATVTAGTGDFASCIYVQEQEGLPGIRVELSGTYPPIIRGTTFTVRGLITTNSSGERVVTNATLEY